MPDQLPAGDLRVAMIGCGAISRKYLATLDAVPGARIVACADLLPERAEKVATDWPAIRAMSVPEVLADPDIDLVLNLTVPAAHAEVATSGLNAGKHVFGEKPLSATLAQGRAIVDLATERGLRLGSAPDTVLGTGIQTARHALDAGAIGTPVAAGAFLLSPGPDKRQMNPQFFFQTGAGPLFDMGPYYLTALVTLLGPIAGVVALGRTRTPRHVTAGPNEGMVIDVAVPTLVTALIEHRSGVLTTLVVSWDAPGGSTLPRLELYGTEGTLSAPDPNKFAAPSAVRHTPRDDWESLPPSAGYQDIDRGIGIVDMARAVRRGEPHRAGAELALHVLETLDAIDRSIKTGERVTVHSDVDRPAPVPLVSAADAAGW